MQLTNYFIFFLSLTLLSCTTDSNDNALSKNIPQSIIATAGTRAVQLNWSGVAGVNNYTVYWSNQPGVTQRNGTAVTTDLPTLDHENLSNGVRYYYIVTAQKSSGESSASQQVSAVPFAAVPEAPADVAALAGRSRVTLTWSPVPGASRYSLYWSNSAGVGEKDQRIGRATSPYVHSGLRNGLMYHYIVVAENAQGQGIASVEVQAQTNEPQPTAPIMMDAVVTADDVLIQWQDVGADSTSNIEYDLYWNITGNVSLADAKISAVTSPYRHAPLSSGLDYYYRVQARNSGGVSSLSNSVHVQPPNISSVDPLGSAPVAPELSPIDLGNKQLSLSWLAVSDATAYNLYWTDSTTEILSTNNPNIFKIGHIQSPYTHIQLNNGSRYRYVLSAISDAGESGLSAEMSAIPQVVEPGVPAGVYASSGDEKIVVRWLAVDQARSYIVYVTDELGNEQTVTDAVSPLQVDTAVLGNALINGNVYKIEIAANNAGTVSKRSLSVNVIPHEPPPRAPSNLSAEPGDAEVVLRWLAGEAQTPTDLDEAVVSHRVYYSKVSGVSVSNATVIPELDGSGQPNYQTETDTQGNVTWRLRHGGLANNQRYYYIVTALNIGGESRPSGQVWAKPQAPIPTMPNNIWAEAGNNEVVLHFSEAVEGNVLSYNLYWSKVTVGPVDTTRSSTQVISNISPNYVFKDGVASNGNTYYFQLSTVDAGGESNLSAEVSATPQMPIPQSAPQNVMAISQPTQVTLSWAPVSDADAYALYWSTDANIDTATSARISGDDVTSPYTHTGLTNGQTVYYYLVAVNSGGESSLSSVAVAVPQIAPPVKPRNVVVTAGDTEVLVNWPPVATASSYTLYWDAEPVAADVANWSSVVAQSGTWIPGLLNGQAYQFQLQANNVGGSSALSDVVSVMPELAAPASPTAVTTASGDTQVSINWTTRENENYTLYWTTNPDLAVVPIDSGTQISDVRPTYVHTGLNNGDVFRYQITASHRNTTTGANVGNASVPSNEVSASPASTLATTPQAVRSLAGNAEVSLSWLPPAVGTGPYNYNIYWSNTAGQGTSGTVIANIDKATYVHSGLSNNQTYHYVVTAVPAASGIESAASLASMASPQGQAPGQIMSVWAAPGDTENVIYWQADTQSTQYRVEWSSQVDVNNALQGNIGSSLVVAPSTQFQHRPLLNGQTLYYRVVGQNGTGIGGSLRDGLASATVNATPQSGTNRSPQIAQGSLVSVSMDEDSVPKAFSLSLQAIDSDGDSLTWSVDRTATRGSVSLITSGVAGDTVAVTYDPVPEDNGKDQFLIQVSDPLGGVDVITVEVLIAAQNDAPVFNAGLGDQVDINGANVSVDASATDIDSSNLKYSATGLPSGLNIDINSGIISGVLSSTASAGSPYSVTLTVDDQNPQQNLTDTVTINWLVNTVGADPGISIVSIIPATPSVVAGTTINLVVTAYDRFEQRISTGGEIVLLTITGANANQSADAPIAATDNNDGTYSLSYNAQLAGIDTYLLTMQADISATPVSISGSYNRIITPAAASLSLSVAQIPAGPYVAGAPVSLQAQLRDVFGNATNGAVTFIITGNNPQNIDATAQGGGVYAATYTPTQVGSDDIAVLIDTVALGTPVARSINASAADVTLSSATVPLGPFVAGQSVLLQAQVRDGNSNPASGFVTFDIVDAAAQTRNLTGVSQGGGLYQISYTPTLAGTETITSLVDGLEVTQINGATIAAGGVSRSINPDVADVANTTLTITPADPVTAGSTVNIELLIVDKYLNSTTAASVVINVAGANLQAQALSVQNPSFGRYTANYVAPTSGIDTYSIVVDGIALATPTRTINAGSASLANSRAIISPVDPLIAGDTITIAVEVRDVNNNFTAAQQLSIDVSGGNTVPLTALLQNPSLGNYNVSYVAANAGNDTVAVVIDNMQVIDNALTRTIVPANVAPLDITLSKLDIIESSATGDLVGTLGVVDDAGDTHTYSLLNNAGGRFSLNLVNNAYELQVANAILLDFESATSHVVTIEVTDQGGLSFSRNFNIQINDANDIVPIITNLGLNPSIPENTADVINLTIVDTDTVNAAFVYTLTGPDAAQFEVVGALLKFKNTALPDFELPVDVAQTGSTAIAGDNVYQVIVAVSDGVNNSAPVEFLVNVSNVFDTLTATNLSAAEAFIENSTGFILVPIVVTSPDATPVTITLLPSTFIGGLLIPSGTGVTIANDVITGKWTATGTASNLNVVLANVYYTPGPGDYTNFTVTATVSDGVRPDVSGIKPFTRTPIADIIAASSVNITPLNPLVGDQVTVNVIVRNALGALIEVSSVKVDVTGVNLANLVVSNPSIGTYTANYIASVAGIDTYDVKINQSPITSPSRTISAQNAAPTDITLSGNTVVENSSMGITIGTLGVVDDAGTHTYSLLDNAGGRFSINLVNTAYELQVANGGLLDFETNVSHIITVEVSDQAALTFSRNFTISVSNAPEAVTLINVTSGNGQIKLDWVPLPQPTEQTEIHRAAVTGFTPNPTTLINTTALGVSSYTDIGLSNFTSYYYRLITVQGAVKSAPSATVVGIPTAPIAVPVGLQSVSGDAVVNLSWTPDASLTYEIHRGASSNFVADLASLLDTTLQGAGSYPDTTAVNSQLYYYRLIGVNGTARSLATASVLGAPVSAIAPPAPALSVKGISRAIELTLRPVPGSATVTTTASYKVYFNTTGNVTKADAFAVSNLADSGAATTVTFHSGLTNDQLYYYRAAAISVGGSEGLLSTEQASFPFSVKSRWVKSYPAHPEGLVQDIIYTGTQYVVTGSNKETDLTMTSADDRKTWVSRKTGLGPISDKRSLAHNGKGVVMQATKAGLYRSSDHGNTWSLIDYGADTPPNSSITPTTSHRGVFYVTAPVPAFVAFVANYRAITTDNGTSWNFQSMNQKFLYDFVHDGSRFFAFDGGEIIFSSPDGISWRKAFSAAGGTSATEYFNYFSLAGNATTGAIFIVASDYVDSNINRVYACNPVTDILNCTIIRSANFQSGYRSVAYSPPLKAFLRYSGGRVFSTTDSGSYGVGTILDVGNPRPEFGIEWIEKGAQSHLMLKGIKGTVASSTDGKNWTRNTPNNAVSHVIWGGNQFVAVGDYFTATSPNAINWNWTANANLLRNVNYDGTMYTAIGAKAGMPVIITSIDGVNWTSSAFSAAPPQGTFLLRVASNKTVRVAVGGDRQIFSSTSGGLWTAAKIVNPPAAGSRFESVAWNGVAFVAISNGTSQVYRSVNGIDWSLTYNKGLVKTGLAVKDGIFYMAAAGESITSVDGLVWTSKPATFTPNYIYWDGKYFWSTNVYVSIDAEHWNLTNTTYNFRTLVRSPTATIYYESTTGIFR